MRSVRIGLFYLSTLRSQAGQAVVEMVLAIPILIALFAACLQLLHLGMAHIVVELAAFEATRQATLANMNIADARNTAEDICKVLGPGRTEVKYQDNPPGYTIIHHLQTIVPIIRELKVEHSFPSYVFLPGYDIVPGSATSPSHGGGGGNSGNSPNYNPGGSGGGSHMEVADYDPDEYADQNHTAAQSGNGTNGAYTNPSMNPMYLSSVNPQTLPEGLEPYHSPPGGEYSESLDEEYASDSSDAYDPSDADLILDSSYENTASDTRQNGVIGAGVDTISSGDEKSFRGSSSLTEDSRSSTEGGSSPGSSHIGGPTSNFSQAGDSTTTPPPLRGGGEGEGESLLEKSARAAGEAAGKRADETLAFYEGAAEGYLGDSNTKNAFWAGHRWANQKTEESRARLDQQLSELDAKDQELDKAKGLKKIVGKASVKSKKIGAMARNIVEEGIYDIPKAGQDLPDAWKNTKAAGREMMAGNWKNAAKAGGKAVGILANEAGRVSWIGGRAKQLAKGAKSGLRAATRGATTKIGKTITENAAEKSKKYYRYVDDKEAEVIKKTGKIPNTNINNEPKNVYITDKKYETSGKAKTHLQLPNKPTHRVEIDADRIKNKTPLKKIKETDNPQWGKGGGKESTTRDTIEVEPSKVETLK